MNPNQKLGRVTIKVDGDVIESYADAEIDTGGFEISEKENGNFPGHWSEKKTPGRVKCKIDWGESNSIEILKKWRDVTLTCELDSGQTYVGAHYTLTKIPPITTEQVELEFYGPAMEEMTVV